MRWKLFATFITATLLTSQARAEEIETVSLCQLLSDPAAFNHKLIQISGQIWRGFEEFTISDENCNNGNTVWLELGGNQGSEVMYCCNVPVDPERPKPLVVEGIETTIVRDKLFRRFQELTKRRGTARATVVGRYFSGEQQTLPGGTFWMGYGHMGMASLLVIQQVVAVDRGA